MAGNSEIKEEYTSSLQDLTFNSKPLISVLTILAEENVAHAKDIVEAIETHLSRVRTEVKLPVLYLIDCIIKNVGGPYTALFCQNIVSTFCSVFEQVDERTRAEMFRLRQTWNDVIPPKKLYALDVQITQLDPAWPVTAPPPSSIHFNPKFLKTTTTSSSVSATSVNSKPHTNVLSTNASSLDPKTLSMQQKLINKQKELLELQQRKLQLELLQTQVKLQEQQLLQTNNTPVRNSTSPITISNVTHSQNLLLKPEVAKQLSVSSSTNKSSSNMTNTKPKTGTHTVSSVMAAKLQNSSGGPRIAPVNSSLANARPIRDPRLMRHQQQHQQLSSSNVNSNIHLESKSKSGTQVTVESDNKNVNKTTVRNDRVELRLVNNKDGSTDGTAQSMDVDLRQLPAVIGKKRTSTEARESPNAKKSKSEMFDVLFGSEDTDLRQLPPVLSKSVDRPPTPPPPIISEKVEKPKPDSPDLKEKKDVEGKKEASKNSSLDALRAKLANAINQDKLKDPKETGDGNAETKKQKLQSDTDMRKLPSAANRNEANMTKIIISAADEACIKTGNMTKAQEKALMNKIIAQIETQKLREAQKREFENIGNISLQPISDDEFEVDISSSDSEEASPRRNSDFGDTDDRFRVKEDRHKEERAKEERVPPIPPQISLLEDAYPKYPRIIDHRDPRRGRPWRGRHRKNWEMPLPMARPGIRPYRPMPEPWMRPTNESWRSMGPPGYPGGFGPDQTGPNMPPFGMEQGSHSPTSNSQDIPALEYAHPDSYKFITIDNEPREIRYYDETAIVFMNAGDPREITFHNGIRRIFFDGEPFTLKLNSPYEEISIKGNLHKVRLGAPSREIFIDGKGYECYFDQNEKTIDLDGNKIVVKLEPPPPQVKIGQEKRLDLVAGKVQLVVDAKNMFTVFLDAKPQTFEIDGATHTLKFIDALRAVLINEVRFEVEFGGLPKPVLLNEKKHFIRFSVLPKGIKPGHLSIKDMEICQPLGSPKNDENSQDDQLPVQTIGSGEQLVATVNKKKPFEGESPERNSNSPHHFQNLLQQQNFNNLDMLTSVMASSLLPSASEGQGGYKVDNVGASDIQHEMQSSSTLVNVPAAAPKETNAPSMLNINDLFQRLVATGIVTTITSSHPEEPPPPASPPRFTRTTSGLRNMKSVLFGRPETLKTRRAPLIHALYLGMQCSSCGMRFPPEQSMYYSQHLDWHFRQNRKGKKNIRKATSRRWYYSLSDWKNYEELEDLEEREKSYFENQQQNPEGANEEGEEEVEIPCVPADPNVQDAACEVCRDKFEQFYNEEKDEWQLRMALRVDDKTYHPLCYDDYQASLVDASLEENKFNAMLEKDTESCGIPGLEVVDEEMPREKEKPENEDDDVMEVIEDIDDEETPTPVNKEEEAPVEEADDDVILNEVVPEEIVVDDYDKDDDISDSEGLIPGVIVKEEPIDDGFVDVEGGLVKTKEVKIKTEHGDNDEAESATADIKTVADTADTTHTEVVSTIDGNVELDAGVPSSNIGGKIKINITKPIPTIVPKDNRDVISEELKSDCIDPSQPLPPGEEPVQLNVKPALQGLELRRQPAVKKGSELTGLCSIM